MTSSLRLGLVGATGTLGREVILVLEEEGFPIQELRVFAGERSLGEEVELNGRSLPIESGQPEFQGLDAVLLCTPASVALDLIRQALRVEVPCIDCSGALLGSNEVPLVIADLGAHDGVQGAPLISGPGGPTLVWGPVLSALQREAGLVSIVGTVLHSASSLGRAGIEALSEQTLSLLNQRLPADSDPFPGPMAFDTLVHAAGEGGGEGAKDGAAPAEGDLMASLYRLLGPGVRVAVTSVHVPSFAGQGGALRVETERPLSPEEARRVFSATAGISLLEDVAEASTRSAVGSPDILLTRLRADPSAERFECSLLFWLAADPVRLAALNAVKLLRARFSLA